MIWRSIPQNVKQVRKGQPQGRIAMHRLGTPLSFGKKRKTG